MAPPAGLSRLSTGIATPSLLNGGNQMLRDEAVMEGLIEPNEADIEKMKLPPKKVAELKKLAKKIKDAVREPAKK